ncbi:zinc carboxypeptidase [candidate division KSB1 bacterium]|nr:zinc carboxypeptidase [candidate division KSB1 bacterium]
MKRTIAIIMCALFLLGATSLLAHTRRQIVQVHLEAVEQQVLEQFFRSAPDILSQDRKSKTVDVLCSESDLRFFRDLGLDVSIIIENADDYARQLREIDYLKRFHTFDEMLQEMQAAHSANPQLTQLVDIGDSYDKTVGRGGYDIWVIKISDNAAIEEDEPEVFFMANMHAREIITPEIILNFMHYLLDNYGYDPYVTHLVNNREIWLCPTFNPDGHEYVFSGTNLNNYGDPLWWRKNKRDNNGNGSFDPYYDGVDLNRNFGYAWGNNNGSSPNPTSETYRGPAPFSEPENQAIRDFVIQHNFLITLSFHSYSQLWLYPWGFTSAHTPDHQIFVALADCCVAYNDYEPDTGYGLYPVSGDTDDWFYGEQEVKNKIYAFTPEVGSGREGHPLAMGYGFHPDTSYIEKQISENLGPQLYMAYAAGEEPIIVSSPLADTENSA